MARRKMKRRVRLLLAGVLMGLLLLWVGFVGASGPEVERRAQTSEGQPPAAGAPQATAGTAAGEDHVFLFKWGAQAPVGEFNHPTGVAVAADGTVYIVEWDNHRVQRFTSAGTFLGAWGSQGSGDGQFWIPIDVAIASDGTVYVADYYNHRIQRFTSTGGFLGKWGSEGSGDGQFTSPGGVAVAADGTIYVADTGNRRIQRFTATGTFLGKWGSEGSGDGQFFGPNDVAVAADGSVYAADTGNRRIQRFTATGEFLGEWGSEGSGDGQFASPHSVAVAADGTVYVAEIGNDRIQRFTSTGEFLGKWGSRGSGDGHFEWPYGVAVATDGTVYVADYFNDRVQRFTSTGGFLGVWRSGAFGDGQFNAAWKLAVAGDGTVYIADTYNDRIQRFTSTGGFLGKWGSSGSGDGQFKAARDVAVAADGTIYISDVENNRIQRFTSTGEFLGKWGSRGPSDGQFRFPQGVAVAVDGTVYVADSGNHRIQAFGTSYPDYWRGEYYANRWLVEAPSVVREDAVIDFDWGSGSPWDGDVADEFSVRWSRYVWLNANTYHFTAFADDGVRLRVDGTLLVDEWSHPQSSAHEASISLESGYHQVEMEYYEQDGSAAARLSWEPPGGRPPGGLRTITSPYTSLPPQIDGRFDEWPLYLDDLVLDSITAYHRSPEEYIAPSDLSGTLRSQWDESYVYFAIHVQDDHLVADSPSELWRDDVIQIGIDANHNHERDWGIYSLDHQYTIRYDGMILDWLSSEGMEQVLHAERIVAGGYDVELAIPVSELSTDALFYGQVMGFNLQLQDDDDGGNWDKQLIWEGEDTTSCSKEYGHLLFRESGPPTPTPTVTPSITPTPTLTATPTATRAPTLAPTLPPTPGLLFLPTVLKGFPAS